MRVAAHNGATIWGGAERATVMLLRGLMDRGHEVVLLCNSALVASEAMRRGVPARRCVLGGDFAVFGAFHLASVLRDYRPDVFVVGTYKKLFLASMGARMARVPRIVARVGLESDTPRSYKYRFALRTWVDGVAVNARRIVQPFANLDGFGASRVALIPNGVRFPDGRDVVGSLRSTLGIDRRAVVIGTVARLARQKRIDRLLEAARSLPENVVVVIAGDGTQREALEHLAADQGLSSRVHFLGHSDNTSEVLAALDIFVVSSDSEGLSNAMLEAMACGLPVVSTPVSGAVEALVADAENPAAGIIAEFSPGSIAAAVRELIDDPVRRESMGSAARNRARARFSMDLMLDRWEAFLFPSFDSSGPPAVDQSEAIPFP